MIEKDFPSLQLPIRGRSHRYPILVHDAARFIDSRKLGTSSAGMITFLKAWLLGTLTLPESVTPLI